MSLEIIRVTEQAGIDYMLDHIVADTDETKEEIVSTIRDLLADQKDRTLILQAWDVEDEKEPVLQAFIIAYVPPNGNYSFIIQAWKILKPVDSRVMDRLFFRLQYWTDSWGRTEIRGETTRKTEPFLRKWKFEHISSVLRYTIPVDFELPQAQDRKENGNSNVDSVLSGEQEHKRQGSEVTERYPDSGGVQEATSSTESSSKTEYAGSATDRGGKRSEIEITESVRGSTTRSIAGNGSSSGSIESSPGTGSDTDTGADLGGRKTETDSERS